MLTLFQIITLEGWVEIMENQGGSFFVPIYFIVFILLGTMVVLNLFIGVIMTGFEETKKEIGTGKSAASNKKKLKTELEEINDQITEISARLNKLVDSKNDDKA
ncbi:MAG: ion transporter [Candidatus Aenigmarchaeota archaeon]|nr:ion transporter [Candidatus Aenigmarchaeota archaeon]